MGNLIDVNQLAFLLGVTPRWIQRLVDEHGMPRSEHGMYDSIRCVQWYCGWLRSQAKGTVQDHKARKERAEADLKELDLARKRGEVAEVAKMQRHFVSLIRASQTRLLPLATRLAPQFARETSAARIKKSSKTSSMAHSRN